MRYRPIPRKAAKQSLQQSAANGSFEPITTDAAVRTNVSYREIGTVSSTATLERFGEPDDGRYGRLDALKALIRMRLTLHPLEGVARC